MTTPDANATITQSSRDAHARKRETDRVMEELDVIDNPGTPLRFLGKLMLMALFVVSVYVIFYAVELWFHLPDVELPSGAEGENLELKSTKEEPVILLVFNGEEYAKEAANTVASIKKNCPKRYKDIMICVSDSHSKKFAQDHKFAFIEFPTIEGNGEFGSVNFNMFTIRKLEAIQRLLEEGQYVMYTDTDIAWIKDPIPQVLNELGNLDMILQDDGAQEKQDLACTGFLYCRPSPTSIKIMQDTIALMHKEDFAKGNNDQNAIQMILPKYHGKWGLLHKCLFPNGARYMKHKPEYMKSCQNSEALIFHANYIKGPSAKMAAMKKYKLWFAD